MALANLSAVVVVAAMTWGMTLYIRTIISQSKKAPVLATWLLFGIATSLSLWMYLESKEHSWVANIGNVFDPIMCWAAVLVLVYCSRQRWGRVVFDFDWVQIVCFILAGLIIAYWSQTNSAFLANLALQAVIVVGYVPTWRKLWLAAHNTEPVKVWLIFLFGSLVSLIPAWVGDNTLAKVYAVRATICTLILFFFMIRAELREPEEK